MATIDERKLCDGRVAYRVRVRIKGHPDQMGTFNRLTDAKRWAQQIETAIREGRFINRIDATKHTLSEAIDRYIKVVLPQKPKSFLSQRQQLLWWRQKLGGYSLADITPARLSEAREDLQLQVTRHKRKTTPATVNRYMAALSHVFTIAKSEWMWVDENPVRRVRNLREPRGRDRYLSEDERRSLLAACLQSENPCLYPIVILAIATGMRKGEILNLKWDDVDFARSRITLQETKNGERRGVPLVSEALRALKEHSKVRRLNSSFVFSSPSSHRTGRAVDIRASWESALKAANLANFRFHDLRHTTASYLAMNGASLADISAVLGHKTLSMVKRYAHLSDTHVSTVVEKMNNRIFDSHG